MSEVFEGLNHEQKKVFKEIGYSLKEKREDLGYTLDYVSDIIRVSVYNIQQLEVGNCEALKSVLFLRGSLRNYCNFLQLDSKPFLSQIDKVLPSRRLKPLAEKDERKKEIWQSSFFINLISSAIILSAIVLGVYFLFFFNFGNEEEINIIESPKTEIIKAQVENPTLILAVDAKKDGWIRIKVDENRTFEIFLKKKVNYQWIVSKDFKITLATAELGDVLLNNKIANIPQVTDNLLELNITSF